ncbi:MAG: dnaE [Gammaproteobacteria bacterium]|nr:dnaE [Gammaproteobacteria bacterium]
MQETFVHLHLHSEYSIQDGLIRIEPLLEAAAGAMMPALAITEQGNLFSLIKFYRQALSSGIKPVIGCELRICRDGKPDGNLVLLCQNNTGYRSLTRLITRSYTEGQIQGLPHVEITWLDHNTAELIALSCGRDGNIGQAILHGNPEAAKANLAQWRHLFPDRFYVELQRTGRQGEDLYVREALRLAADMAVPVVASNDVRFIERDDYEAHEARVCIQQGMVLNDKRRPRAYSEQQYLKTPAEMQELFRDIPEAVANTWRIAKRCNLEFSLGNYYIPEFPAPGGYVQESWLRHKAELGLNQRLRDFQTYGIAQKIELEKYPQRLEHELGVITNMGFAGYFLIVADFIRWAKDQGIPVGPGRGSGAGSLVAYVLGITELDPMRYELLFERFLNPERISLPDFDVDFCMDRRDEVIDYVSQRYGRDHVSQIITFGSMAAKAVIRDVGRVLGHPYGYVDQIAKLVPFELNMTLERALEEEKLLAQRYEEEEEVRILIDLARKLEGLVRNAGRHAGGIIIAQRALTDYMPLYCEQGSTVTTTQFDMGDAEAIGLVKFDFLGLRTLTIIDNAIKDANQVLVTAPKQKIDIDRIPLDDKATLSLIQKTDTTAIFQLESDGMRKLIKRLHPDNFNDLIALVALFRPGPMNMVDDFVERKHGQASLDYLHPALEHILKPTYGVILYQEQVMQIAQKLAGYTLGSADILRRAMGKKKPEEMAKQRNIFVDGAIKNGVTNRLATYIFDLMEKFAGYGFNKSHSTAYALLAYQTAWLKAHYPAAFMAAVLSSDMDNTDKIVTLREELRRMQINLLPPSVNVSVFKFHVIDVASIRFGLGAIKGVGRSAIESILLERESGGNFRDLFDLCKRVDARKVNKRVLEALIRSGATDELGPGRSSMMASLGKAMQLAEQHSANKNTGQNDMFGLDIKTTREQMQIATSGSDAPFIYVDDWSEHERLIGEKETLGFYLEGHPITRYQQELACIITTQLRDVKPGRVIVAGYIENIRTRSGMRGRMAEIRLDDRTARVNLTLYSEVYQKYRSLLITDNLIIVRGEALVDDYYDFGYYIKADSVHDLNKVRNDFASLKLKLDKTMLANGTIAEIKHSLLPYAKHTRPVSIEYDNGRAVGRLDLGQQWHIELNDQLIEDLSALIGEENVRLDYHNVNLN